jgi:cell division protein FtsZ
MNIPLEMLDSITESTLNIGSKDMDQLQAAISGTGILFLVADFEENNWTGVTKSLAKAAENAGVPILAIIRQYEPEELHRNEESAIESFSDTSFPILFLPRMQSQSPSNDSSPKDLSRATHEVIFQAIQGVSTLITSPGFIGVDMADIRSFFASGRYMRVGSGAGKGEKAVTDALTEALNAPILSPSVLYEAKGILFNLTSGPDLHMEQFEEAVETIQSMTNPHSLLIAGIPIIQAMDQGVRVMIMCAGE